MPLWRGRQRPLEKGTGEYYVLILEDLAGRSLEVRKHSGFWSGEDELRQQDLRRWLGSLSEQFPQKPNTSQRLSMDGERGAYVAAFGAGLRLGGVVPLAEKGYWEARFGEALVKVGSRARLGAAARNLDPRDLPTVATLMAWLLQQQPSSSIPETPR